VLDGVKPYITILVLPYSQADKLKQGYYYLTQVLTRCTKLRHLHLRCFTNNTSGSKKFTSALIKGLNNLFGKEEAVPLETLTLHNFREIPQCLDWLK